MERKNVMLKNLSGGPLYITLPELHYKRSFERQGAVKPMPYEVLQEAMWHDGFSYMLRTGLIEILDKEVCEELRILNTSDVKEFVKEKDNYDNEIVLLVLDDAQKKRYLTVAPVHELKVVLTKLTTQQKREFADFAIKNKLIDYQRNEVIKQITGIDIVKAIEFNNAMEG